MDPNLEIKVTSETPFTIIQWSLAHRLLCGCHLKVINALFCAFRKARPLYTHRSLFLIGVPQLSQSLTTVCCMTSINFIQIHIKAILSIYSWIATAWFLAGNFTEWHLLCIWREANCTAVFGAVCSFTWINEMISLGTAKKW